MARLDDITGKNYGHWTVLGFDSIRKRVSFWRCRCSCGKERVIRGSNMKTGESRSCGCNGGVRKRWRKTEAHHVAVRQARRVHKVQFNRADQRRRAEIRLATLQQYGGKCMCCGEKTPVFLAFDHINGGGHQHRSDPSRKRFSAMGIWLKEHGYPAGFQILCNNCNWAKHANGVCPHQVDAAVAAMSFGS